VLNQDPRPHLGYARRTIGADLALPLSLTWKRPCPGSVHARCGREGRPCPLRIRDYHWDRHNTSGSREALSAGGLVNQDHNTERPTPDLGELLGLVQEDEVV
jgi:hypothetical protein